MFIKSRGNRQQTAVGTKFGALSAEQTRIRHIDIAKAVGIMLIIASHVWTTNDLRESCVFKAWDAILNSFYVPLFFMLSGVFESSDTDWGKYFRRLVRLGRYLAIFAVFGFCSVGLIRKTWTLASCVHGTVIWFLIALFWITVIFGLIKHLRHNWRYVVLLSGLGALTAYCNHSFFYIGQALLCLPFYAAGFYLKDFLKYGGFRLYVFGIGFAVWLAML